MSFSYEGIGEWCATFEAVNAAEGKVVKLSGNGKVTGCAANDAFCGVVRAVSHDGKACSVQLGGMATVPYSGQTAPGVGFAKLAADGAGGVAVNANGASYLAVAVDTAEKTVTIRL